MLNKANLWDILQVCVEAYILHIYKACECQSRKLASTLYFGRAWICWKFIMYLVGSFQLNPTNFSPKLWNLVHKQDLQSFVRIPVGHISGSHVMSNIFFRNLVWIVGQWIEAISVCFPGRGPSGRSGNGQNRPGSARPSVEGRCSGACNRVRHVQQACQRNGWAGSWKDKTGPRASQALPSRDCELPKTRWS